MTAWEPLGSCLTAVPSSPLKSEPRLALRLLSCPGTHRLCPLLRFHGGPCLLAHETHRLSLQFPRRIQLFLSYCPEMFCCCSAEVSVTFRSLLGHHTPEYYTVNPHHSQSIFVVSPTHQHLCVAPQISTDGIRGILICKEVKHTSCPFCKYPAEVKEGGVLPSGFSSQTVTRFF